MMEIDKKERLCTFVSFYLSLVRIMLYPVYPGNAGFEHKVQYEYILFGKHIHYRLPYAHIHMLIHTFGQCEAVNSKNQETNHMPESFTWQKYLLCHFTIIFV